MRKLFLTVTFLLILFVATSLVVPKEIIRNISQKEATTTLISRILKPLQEIITTKEKKPVFEYIEVTNSCGPYFEGVCLNVRSGPGKEYPVTSKLRNGVVLKVGERLESNNEIWYRIVFDEWIRYEDRLNGDWYVSGKYVKSFLNEGIQELSKDFKVTTDKYILVDRSEQKLYAYEGKKLFMKESISTGIELSPTPRGVFKVFKKTPSRYMQGPLPGISEKYYDLPGVPWNLYFTEQGAVIHGAYWHDNFGKKWSSGCVNLDPEKAKELYMWAEIGMEVTVRD